MVEKYFMHRIQKENGSFSKGIEVHDTLNSAILSFWGRMKLGYGKNPDITFVACEITDGRGNVVKPYDIKWIAESEVDNIFFLHHIRLDGENFTKDIDVLDSYDTACGDFAAQMEYGYNNPKFPNVSFVSCKITDLLSGTIALRDVSWIKPEPEVEPEQNGSE